MLTLSFQIAVVAFVYCEVLIQHGHILHPFYQWLTDLLTIKKVVQVPDNTPEEVKQLQGYKAPMKIERIITKKRKILKALGECPYCTAGQMMLWVFLIRYGLIPHTTTAVAGILYFIGWLIFTISFSILLIMVLKKANDQWEKQLRP